MYDTVLLAERTTFEDEFFGAWDPNNHGEYLFVRVTKRVLFKMGSLGFSYGVGSLGRVLFSSDHLASWFGDKHPEHLVRWPTSLGKSTHIWWDLRKSFV